MHSAKLKILYLTSNGGIHDYRFLKKLVNDYEVLLLHYSASNLIDDIQNIKGLKIISKKPLIKSFPLLSEYFHLKKCVSDFKPDLIHSGYVWQVGILAALLNFHPHVSMPWGSDILVEPGNNFLLRLLTRKTMKQSDHIQCDAEFVKKKIIDDYKIPAGKITVFPWGIDLDIFKQINKSRCRKQLGVNENDFIIIFNRALENIYGINYLLQGFRDFSVSKNNVQLLMLSDGSLKKETLKYIEDNNLSGKIKPVGRVPNTALPVYLNAADVYISTSLSDGTSLSLLEAMACGPGLIVTGVPAIKEWVNDSNGIVISSKSSDAVAAALEKYYNDRNLIAMHSLENLKIASVRADWDKNYLELKEIYKSLLN